MFEHTGGGSLAAKIPWLAPIFILGLAFGALVGQVANPREFADEPELVEVRASGYRYIRPLVECEIQNGLGHNRELTSFRQEIKNKVDLIAASGAARHVSVYFRDLNNGPTFSINPKEDFVPASLMKVPLLVGVMKIAETDPGFLDYQVKLPPDFPSERGHTFSPEDELKPGSVYTILNLARRMIVYSDNNAVKALYQFLPEGTDRRTFADLGIGLHGAEGRPESLSVESYASVFRILFNSSYLNREMSEKALSLLAEAKLPHGLNRLAPVGVDVVQKFGNIQLRGHEETVQLHLCGIVYYPGNPYLVCAMTRGDEVADLIGAINEVGAEVYRQVDLRASASAVRLVN